MQNWHVYKNKFGNKLKQTNYKENTLMRTCCEFQRQSSFKKCLSRWRKPLIRGPYHKSVQGTLRSENIKKSYELQKKIPVHLEAPEYYSNTCRCFRKESKREALTVKTDFFPDVSYSNFKFKVGISKISVRKLFCNCTNLSVRQLVALVTDLNCLFI